MRGFQESFFWFARWSFYRAILHHTKPGWNFVFAVIAWLLYFYFKRTLVNIQTFFWFFLFCLNLLVFFVFSDSLLSQFLDEFFLLL
jgi:hypothetical protein